MNFSNVTKVLLVGTVSFGLLGCAVENSSTRRNADSHRNETSPLALTAGGGPNICGVVAHEKYERSWGELSSKAEAAKKLMQKKLDEVVCGPIRNQKSCEQAEVSTEAYWQLTYSNGEREHRLENMVVHVAGTTELKCGEHCEKAAGSPGANWQTMKNNSNDRCNVRFAIADVAGLKFDSGGRYSGSSYALESERCVWKRRDSGTSGCMLASIARGDGAKLLYELTERLEDGCGWKCVPTGGPAVEKNYPECVAAVEDWCK